MLLAIIEAVKHFRLIIYKKTFDYKDRSRQSLIIFTSTNIACSAKENITWRVQTKVKIYTETKAQLVDNLLRCTKIKEGKDITLFLQKQKAKLLLAKRFNKQERANISKTKAKNRSNYYLFSKTFRHKHFRKYFCSNHCM